MKFLSRQFNRLRAAPRLLLCLAVAVLALVISWQNNTGILTSLLIGWNAFCVTLLGLSGILFFSATASDVRQLAQRQDESRYAIFLLVLGAVCISLVGILVLMKPEDNSMISKNVHHAVSLLGVGMSWLLMHTMFTLRYAHMYYTDPTAEGEAQIGGLEFPKGETAPDYLDFVYFSFIIGMTFQVSDVEISSRSIRRVVLLHSILSFVYNTIIVALTIGALSNLGH